MTGGVGGLRARLVSVVALATAATAGFPAVAHAQAGSGWLPSVAPIARQVEQLRELKFEYAVPVDFLSDKSFRARVTQHHERSPAAEQAAHEAEAELRAIGLVPADFDVIRSVDAAQSAAVLAFYDSRTKRITARGASLIDAPMKVTLAHELTHALQDQHFDLDYLERTARQNHASDALRALVEGDAVRVQQLYLKRLSEADQKLYAQSQAEGSSALTRETKHANVPDAVVADLQAPYALGPVMLDIVVARHSQTIDDLFLHPPSADLAFLDPLAVSPTAAPVTVATPTLRAHEVQIGKSDVLGAWTLYLMLAGRAPLADSLAVATGWAGDSMITFTRTKKTCLRVNFAGRSAQATSALASALTAWVASMPAGSATSARDGDLVTLTACDPGSAVPVPPNSATLALVVALYRNETIGGALTSGASAAQAECAGNALVRDPAVDTFFNAAVEGIAPAPDAATAVQQRLRQILADCR